MMNSRIDYQKVKDLNGTQIQTLLKTLQPKVTKYIVHQPYVKQQVFMMLQQKEAFYGGAAGGGKSDALLMCALQYVDVPGYSAIIFRKTFADLVKPGALIDRAKEWLSPWTTTKEVRWVEKERKFVFPSGAVLQFGYLETDSDRFNYQGGEYQFVGFDEVTHISEVCYKYMFSRLRRLMGVDIPLRVRAASNPPDDDDDAEWVYNRFVNPETRKKHIIFLPAGMDDNPYLDKETYRENLEELDPVTRARLRDGIWTLTRKGNMFKRDWFEIVDFAPPQRRQIRAWDCAGTEKKKGRSKGGSKDPDWTVGCKISEYQGIYYIEDFDRRRARPHEVSMAQRAAALSDGRRVAIREEQEPGSSGLATIDFKARGDLKGFNYKGVRSTGSKAERANAASAAAERGHIKVLRGCRNIEDFFNEAESFPGGAHDDMVDAFSLGFSELGNGYVSNQQVEAVNAQESSYWEDTEEPEVPIGILSTSHSRNSSYWHI